MAFESHRGNDVWSKNLPADNDTNYTALAKMGLAAGGVGLAGLYAYKKNDGDIRPTFDYLSRKMRRAGSLTPFQLLNTFRVPEFMSFFTSIAHKTAGLDEKTGQIIPGDVGEYTWGRSAISNTDTFDYVSRITGRKREELVAMGYDVSAMQHAGPESRSSIVFEEGKMGMGNLFFQNETGERSLLSRNIMVGAYSQEIDVNTVSYKSGEINKAAEGIMRAVGVGERQGDSLHTIFRYQDSTGTSPARMIPVPSILGSVDSVGDIARRTSFVRGIYSFSANRFNELTESFVDMVGGDTGKDFLRNVLGVNPKVAGGTASALVGRYAGRAAALGGLYLGAQQVDWMRRQSGAGEVAASGIFSGVAAYSLHRMGHNRLAMGAAISSFFGQMILPGFDEGIVPGIASTYASMDVIRGSPMNPFSHYRRTIEGMLPGFTGIETTAAFGAMAVLATAIRNPFDGNSLGSYIQNKYGNITQIGQKGLHTGYGVPREALSATDIYWEKISDQLVANKQPYMEYSTGKQRASLFRAFQDFNGDEADSIANQIFLRAEKQKKEIMQESLSSADGLNFQLVDRLKRVSQKYQGKGFGRSVMMNIEGFGVQAFYSIFGADASYNKTIRSEIASLGFKGPVGKTGRLTTVALAGMALHSVISGNLLGSMETAEELSDIYSGKKLVEVKEGRFWEAGGTPYEGGATSYFRPHQIALLRSRTRERGVWGEDEDTISPISKFMIKNFTYDLERQNYYSRPYQMTGAAFQDVPIVGHLLAATIGQVFKPSKIMHADEWMRLDEEGDVTYGSIYKGSKAEPAYALGAPKPGVPVSPMQATELIKQSMYQFRELEGMTGWAKNIVQSLITGSQQFQNPHQVIETSNEMDSTVKHFWDASMGGLGFTNELVRRLLPPNRSGLTKQNAIRNDMPSWLPDKFHYGDPYTKVQWGEARLPGAGYAALHPELDGLDPAAYPLIARYAILGDISPTSYEFNKLQKQIYETRYQGGYSLEQEKLIDDISLRAAAVINKIDFNRRDSHAYRSPIGDLSSNLYLNALSAMREVAAPAEYLFPMGFRPTQKLTGHLRTPIEEYEHQRMYGTNMAFWDKPVRDWFRPAAYSAAHLVGFDGKPVWRHKADAASAEWDKLEFVKWMRLAEDARMRGESREVDQYQWAASQTRSGVNPQGSPLGIYWALPEQDRAFFNAFANADGLDRERILEMVPSDQTELYKAVWSRMDNGDSSVMYPSNNTVSEEYLNQQYQAVSSTMASDPPIDWIGWNAEVDMEDIKVRYAKNHALDLQDYGMWEKQLRKSMNQEFLEEAEYVVDSPNSVMANELRNQLGSFSGLGSNFHVANITGMSRVGLRYDDNRESAILSQLKRWGF